ncbi:hypothetical protein JCM16303_005522 [Sporobolomyces ruberrimus]
MLRLALIVPPTLPLVPNKPVPPHLSLARGDPSSQLFQTRTRTITHHLAKGHHVPRELLYKLLSHRKIPPSSIAIWISILNKRDPIYALEKLGLLESASRADEISLHYSPSTSSSSPSSVPSSTTSPTSNEKQVMECPDWLYLSIPSMVTTQAQAPYLASQLLSSKFLSSSSSSSSPTTTSLPEKSRSIFLSRSITSFLKVKHYVALRELVEYVGYTRGLIEKEESFARILDALSSERERTVKYSSAPTELLHSLRDLVVGTMRERRVERKSLGTWLPLFSTQLVPREPDQVLDLLREMQSVGGLKPKRKVLHQVMRVLVRNGRKEDQEKVEEIWEELKKVSGGGGMETLSRIVGVRRKDGVPLHLRGELDSDGKVVEIGPEDVVREEETSVAEDVSTSSTQQINSVTASESTDTTELASTPETRPPILETSNIASRALSSHPPSTSSTSSVTPTRIRSSQVARTQTDIYSTTRMMNRTTSLAYFAELRAYLDNRRLPFPRPPFPSDQVTWSALFRSVIHETSTISSKFLMTLVKSLEQISSLPPSSSRSTISYIPPRPTLRLYTILMRSLLVRDAPQQAISIFQRLESQGHVLDSTIVSLQVQALCSLDRPREAIRLIHHYQHVPSLHPPSSLVSLRTPPSSTNIRRPHSIKLDIIPFNSILSHLNQIGSYQRVWTLFKELEKGENHGNEIRPDVATLTILVDTARYASVEAGRGWGLGMEELGQVYVGAKRTRSVVSGGTGMGAKVGDVDDKWDRVPAAKRIESFVWEEIVEKNWQEAQLENPLESKSGVSRWFRDRFSSASSPTRGKNGRGGGGGGSFADRFVEPPRDWQPFTSTLSPNPPLHPNIHPTDPFIRSLILLTGVHSHIPLIGQILAWSRWTNVKPSRYTLCLALVFIEGDAGIKRDKVERLREWMGEWVGVGNVPSEEEIAWMRRGGRVKGKPELR